MRNPIDLEGIRAREQAATPGPWEVGENWQGTAEIVGNKAREVCYVNIESGRITDAQFIAHARQDVRDLLAEVERLQTLCDQLNNFEATQTYKLLAENKRLQGLLDEMRDDFIDFACGGIPNLAPYCGNKTDSCVDGRGWCKNEPGVCKGFCPSAWRGFSEREGDQ